MYMLCQHCKKNQANTHIKRVINGEKTEMDLCSECAAKLGVDEYKAAEALNASQTALSLSGDPEEGCVDIPVPSEEDSLTDRLSLRQALVTLSSDDRRLITLRYFARKTQTETARALGTTQVQISRREKRILLRLRSMLI